MEKSATNHTPTVSKQFQLNYQEIIVSFAILIGILLFRKTKPIILQIILAGLIACFILTFFDDTALTNISFFGFGLLAIISFAIAIAGKNWLLTVISFFVSLKFLWNTFHWPYLGELRALMIIPLFCLGLIIYKWRNHLDYLSIAVIFSVVVMIEFFTLVKGWT